MNFLEALKSTTAGELLITFFISMLPVVELRGAIPYGAAMGLNVWAAAGVSIVGNMLPVPFIILFIRKIFRWLRAHTRWVGKVITKIENKAWNKQHLVDKYQFLGLVIIVAIPLPGTGAWTGSLLAALMKMRIKDAVPAILLGVLIAALVVSLITLGVVHIV